MKPSLLRRLFPKSFERAVGDYVTINGVDVLTTASYGDTQDDKFHLNYLDAYGATASVYQAIRGRTHGFLKLTPELTNSAGKVINDRKDLQPIFFPNTIDDYEDFWTKAWMSLDLSGRVIIWCQPNEARTKTIGFKVLYSDNARLIPGSDRYIEKVEYMVNGHKIDIPGEQIIYKRYIDPHNDYDGLSPLAAAAGNVLTEQSAVKFGLNFYKQGINTGLIFTNKDNIDEKSFDKTSAIIRNKYEGQQNFHKSLILDKSWDIHNPSMTNREAEVLASRKWTKIEIGGIFCVPANKMGIWDDSGVVANSDEMNLAFWEDCIDPMSDIASAIIARAMISKLGITENIKVKWQYPSVKVLQYRRTNLREELDWGIKNGVVSRNHAREVFFRIPPINTPAMNEPLISWGVITVSDYAAPSQAAEFADDIFFDVTRSHDEEHRALITGVLAKRRVRYENSFAKTMKSLFEKQEKAVVAALQTQKSAPEVVARFVTADEIFDPKTWEAEFLGEWKTFERGLMLNSARFAFDKWKMKGSISVDSPVIAHALGARAKMFSNIQKTTLDKIKTQLKAGQEAKESITEITGRIKSVFTEATTSRARAIAVTETTFGQNSGIHAAILESDLKHKTWLTSRDDEVREGHLPMENVTIPKDEDFNVKFYGAVGPFPGATGVAESDINCRCSVIPTK